MGMVEGGALEFYKLIKAGLLQTNPVILYETPATALIKNPATGEIVGVKASQNGSEINIKASKAVIMACGDYSANPQMLSDLHYLCDDAQVKSYSLVETPMDAPSTWAWCHSGYKWSADNSAEIEKGWIIKADTIEELAAKMTTAHYLNGMPLTVDAAGLAATIAEYNAGCEAGSDAFGRDPAKLKPINTAPYYAAEIVPSALYTIGGVSSDEYGRVLDWRNQPIARLYAAGDIGQGLVLGPCGVCGCMGAGTLAVRDAATLEAW
jgi:hypothetical protein